MSRKDILWVEDQKQALRSVETATSEKHLVKVECEKQEEKQVHHFINS